MHVDQAAWLSNAAAQVLLAGGEPVAAGETLAIALRRVRTAQTAILAPPLLERAAAVAAALHQPEAATRYLAAAAALRERLGTPPWPIDQPGLARLAENLRTTLGDAAFHAAWEASAALGWEAVAAEVIAARTPGLSPDYA
jgi:hypothetical protein